MKRAIRKAEKVVHTARCSYCGVEFEKSETESLAVWKKKNHYFCSQRHFKLYKNMNSRGYGDMFLIGWGVMKTEFFDELRSYSGLTSIQIQRFLVMGIPWKKLQERSDYTALRFGCAIYDLNRGMDLGEGRVKFDYRLCLAPGEVCRWPVGLEGNSKDWGLRLILRYLGLLSRGDYVGYIRDRYKLYKRKKEEGIEVNSEEYIVNKVVMKSQELWKMYYKNEVFRPYGMSSWEVMLEACVSKRGYLNAELAYWISRSFDYLGMPVDYRLLLPSYGPDKYRDYWRSLFKIK